MYDIQSLFPATNLQDALQALAEQPESQVIAGGTDILLHIREGKLAGIPLISIHELPELMGVHQEDDGTIVIGACTPFDTLASNPIICQLLPWLGEAVQTVGGPQTRRTATIGGNLCNGATSADSAPILLTLNAQLVLQSVKQTRIVPITKFHTGPGHTVRKRDEILTQIRIAPHQYIGFGGQYTKYGKRAAMEISTLGCAALIRLKSDHQTIADLRLAYGVAAPTPIRCTQAEQFAQGQVFTHSLLEEIARLAVRCVSPRTSWRASREFRLQLVEELAKRTILSAVSRAGGVF